MCFLLSAVKTIFTFSSAMKKKYFKKNSFAKDKHALWVWEMEKKGKPITKTFLLKTIHEMAMRRTH